MLEKHTIFDDGSTDRAKSVEHRVTDLREAVRDKNRVNVYIDDKFFCSLDISQVVDFHIKIARSLTGEELADLKRASEFSKFYARALEYVLMRPRSEKELRDYLRGKTYERKVRVKSRKTGEYQTKIKPGYDASLVPPVMQRLEERGYIDDRRFAAVWVENRHVAKGTSIKKLRLELQQKGIASQIIDEVLSDSNRDERAELQKIIARKRARYDDEQKFIQYLLRQGFNYSDIVDELAVDSSSV